MLKYRTNKYMEKKREIQVNFTNIKFYKRKISIKLINI